MKFTNHFSRRNYYLIRTIIFIAFVCCFHSCRDKEIINKIDPAFAKYIDAYTTGTVSKTSTIRIRLAAEVVTTHPVGEVPADELFDFSPAIKGKAVWTDARTIEFEPSENLKPGQLYQISFQLGKVTKTPSGYEKFTFNLQVVKPSFQVTSFGLRATNEKDSMYLLGVLETADIEDDAAVEKLLTASSWKGNLAVSWQHNNDQKVHNFKVENVRRNEKAEKLELEWNGNPLEIDIKGHESIEIPATGDFKVLDIISMNDAQQYASVQFSSMIAVGQELSGLITISNQQDISYTINGSEVKVYGDNKLDGNYTVEIHSGIKNIYGDTLQNGFTANVFFENRLPSVSIRGRGNILPNTGKLVLPFESVNLNAVDINIIKIYENNIPQFLQNNDLGGDEDLRRVAIPVVQKTLRLDDDKTVDLHRKQRFSLDIDKFLKTEPGAIYRVTIGFRPAYSLYECHEESSGENGNGNSNAGNADYEIIPTAAGAEDNFWDRYNDYYPYGYDWNMRDNPCANSYYNKDRWATRNIIASNIGIIAKRTGGNQISVAVSDLLTTKPLANIELEILDFQQQVIAKANSDNEGFAMFKLERKPFLVIAKREGEKGYLRLDDGGSLPLSRFDISGEEVSSGIKGFVFGERGVWRPGDSLFLNCIIEDDDQTLPAGHPVELALFTPRGLLYKKLIQKNETEGFNVFRTAIDANAPTGNWLAKFSVGGATFEKRLRIETVMPNRLKVNLDFGRDAILGKGTSATGTLSARWLFGAIAKNLKAKIDASFYSTKTAFPKYAGFSFDDPTSGYSTQSKTIFDGPLDAEGNARINTAFDSDGQAPGMLTAKFAVKVFEPGGGFSIDNVSVPYSPYESYAGIKLPEGEKPWGMLLTGKDYTTQIINVDNRGALLPGSREVQVQLYKIQWRWWWDNNGDDLSNFTQDKYNKLIKTEMVHLTNGKGQWGFHINDNDWGRYLVLVKDIKSGHKAGGTIYVEQPGWQSRENMDDPTAASMLSFTSDKDKYATGDDITITIPTSKGGRALMSIESGSKVLRMFWVNTGQGQTLVKFKAEENMAPNIYVNVSLLQPHSQTANDLPIRMYGILPLAVENKETILSPVITMANNIRPEQPSTVTVSEQQGREMTYSIAIVDDGLLDLTHFNTPDPHNYFYAKEALGVKTWDLYDNVIGAWGGNLERILTIGGDEGGSGPIAEAKANRFKPIVKYFGPFHLGKKDKAIHNFTLPQYVGSVRVMVVAANHGSYGKAEKSISVKKPLMLLATIPRVLGPGEHIKIPVTVFAMENSIKDVTVTLQTNPFIEIQGSGSQSASFNEPGEQMLYFDAKINSGTGIGKIRITAFSGREKADYDVELDIRNPNPYITNTSGETLSPGKQWQTPVVAIGALNTSKCVLELSSIPSLNLEKRLDYLVQYPHGCIEQTTSSAYPQLVLSQLTNLPDYRKALIDKNIKAAIAYIRNFQLNDGGFSYWPGYGPGDEWGTNYAGNFLLEARDRGYNVGEQMMQEWKLFQRSKAVAWYPSTSNFYGGDLMQAYRLYLLALAGAPEIGAMNRLREFKYISPEARWRLAAAYKLSGHDNVALQLISGLTTNFNKRAQPGVTYGSETRDEAMVLETLTLLGRRNAAADLVDRLAAKLSQDTWYSTQTTAYALVAIAKFCGKNAPGSKILAAVTVNGKAINLNSASYIMQLPVDVSKGASNVSVINKGNGVLYARVITEGQPLPGEPLQVNNNPSSLAMNVTYLDRNRKPIDISKLVQGTDFIAKVVVKNPGNRGRYERMALTEIFPSGWEILNTRLQDGEGEFKSSPYDYQDIRDDRVYTYFDIKENESLTYYVQLNAAYLGKYFLPGIYCAAMYNNSISAGVNGKWVEVVGQ